MTSAFKPQPSEQSHVLRGAGLVILAGFILSLGVFTIRGASGADAWQYLFWRAIGLTLACAGLAYVSQRTSPVLLVGRMTRAGWATAVFMAISQIAFISSIKLTTVAETFILCALAPLMAAVAAWPLYGERITGTVVAAIALALGGVIVMSGGGFSDGAASGRILAIASAVCFAGYTLAVRRAAVSDIAASLIAVGCMAALISGAIVVATGRTFVPSYLDVALAMAHGVLILSVGLYLFGRGARVLSGVTLTLLAQTETVLAPVWGIIFFGEPMTMMLLIGGSMIVSAVVLQTRANVSRAARAS